MKSVEYFVVGSFVVAVTASAFTAGLVIGTAKALGKYCIHNGKEIIDA